MVVGVVGYLLLLAAVLVPGSGEAPASEQHFLLLETHGRGLPALRSQALGRREPMSHSGFQLTGLLLTESGRIYRHSLCALARRGGKG